MSFLDRLLGKRADPTQTWGPSSLPIPDLDVARIRFGTLAFGDTMEAAALLGRPDTFEWMQAEYCQLLYANGGFLIDFDHGQFAYVAFLIGPDANLPRHHALQFSSPRLRGCTPDGTRLSSETGRDFIEELFGSADSVDAEPDEVILYYNRQGVTMEFEMNGLTGRLKRWNLYPQEPA